VLYIYIYLFISPFAIYKCCHFVEDSFFLVPFFLVPFISFSLSSSSIYSRDVVNFAPIFYIKITVVFREISIIALKMVFS